jgi:hypothetical protein
MPYNGMFVAYTLSGMTSTLSQGLKKGQDAKGGTKHLVKPMLGPLLHLLKRKP